MRLVQEWDNSLGGACQGGHARLQMCMGAKPYTHAQPLHIVNIPPLPCVQMHVVPFMGDSNSALLHVSFGCPVLVGTPAQDSKRRADVQQGAVLSHQ